MIDSSKWSVIEAGLKCVQGKAIVNSISMKEGEAEFLRQATCANVTAQRSSSWRLMKKVRRTRMQRKIEICERAYRTLVDQLDFDPQDIIFDPNIFAVATGIEEHNNYAVDFIEATRWIHQNLPGAKISGGVECEFLFPWQ
jgi:5-methyltetrahydrofolate--homocysteine methyltransferase